MRRIGEMQGYLFCAGRRFIEMFVINAVLSVLIFGLFKMSVIPSTMAGCFLSLGFGAVVFWIVNIILLRRCRYDLPDRKAYMISNYIALGAFSLFSIIFLFIVDSETYTWVFAITKFLKYSKLELGGSLLLDDSDMTATFFSALIFHAITAFVIWAAPAGIEALLNDARKTNWQDNTYTVNEIMDAVDRVRVQYNNNDEMIYYGLQQLFGEAKENELRALMGMELLPEEDDDEMESILDENGFIDESKLVYWE